MSKSHAVRYGFSVVFQRPAVLAAEIAWRWTFGAAASILIAYSVLLFLHSLPVSDRDLVGLSGIIPSTYRSALAHIFSGSGPKIVRLIFVLMPGIAFLWWLASAFGRAAVVRELLPHSDADSKVTPAQALRTFLQLNFLRTIIAMLAVFAYIGCIALAIRAAMADAPTTTTQAEPADIQAFFLVFVPLALIVSWLWSVLSWYLTLAPIVSLHNGASVFKSMSDAANFSVLRFGQFAWVGLVFGSLKIFLIGVALLFALTAMGITAQLAPEVALFSIFPIFLGYCAVSDFLATARMASYVRIIEWDLDSKNTPQLAEFGSFNGEATTDAG